MLLSHVRDRRAVAARQSVRLRLSPAHLLFVACCLAAPSLATAEPVAALTFQIGSELAPAEQRALAEQFAPVLVFHPSEQYFPTNPLFPLEGGSAHLDPGAKHEPAVARLGTVDERRRRYEALTPAEKAGLATVYYRAYYARLESDTVIVVEYWLYYVRNTYRVRGNLFPFWVDGSHPNDLEHIHVVVERKDDSRLAVREVYGSAHTGTMPPNRYAVARAPSDSVGPVLSDPAEDDQTADHGRFLVELGSHANAPDIDGDGSFTPGADGSSGYKMQWGIRDRGITWTRYNSSYMDARSGQNSVVFEYAAQAAAGTGHKDLLSYRLVAVDALVGAFAELDLSKEDRQAIFEVDRHWMSRMFGSDNGSSGKLLVPPARSAASQSIGIERFASTERGFLVGTQLNLEQQGLLIGARYAYLLGGTYVPDLMIEADGILSRKQQYLTTQFLVTYPIDGSTTVMAGRALVTDSLLFKRHQWDWVAAIEFPVGHMRVYVGGHSWGPITRFSKEVRLAYFF